MCEYCSNNQLNRSIYTLNASNYDVNVKLSIQDKKDLLVELIWEDIHTGEQFGFGGNVHIKYCPWCGGKLDNYNE